MIEDIDNIDNIITALINIDKNTSYQKICKLSDEEKENYKELLDEFERTNSSDCTTKEKGEALEKIATFIIKSTKIFEVYNNIKTSTNELDQLIRPNHCGRVLLKCGIIDNKFRHFIGECKNYNGTISVTYVGKICSLLTTTQNKICILFSYHGVSGNNWNNSSGLIKKFYLSKEKEEERFCIIDFNFKDFKRIANGGNFLEILEDKIMALQNDVNYSKFITPHHHEKNIIEKQVK